MSDPIRITVNQIGSLITVKVLPAQRITIKVMTAGAQGVPGPPGAAWHIGEVPLGAINGSNDTFVALSDFDPATVEFMYNGVMLVQPDEFHTTGLRTCVFTRTSPPITGDTIRLNYQENQ
jgi:hypothetical protein